jgi:M6 family metalloprotease-like protein
VTSARILLALVLLPAATRADYMDHFVVRDDVGLHKAPYLDTSRLLLIPVEVAGHPPLPMAQVEHFFSADDPNGFVRYFEAASLGRYRPHVTVGPVIRYLTCPFPEDRFPGCRIERGDIGAVTAGMDVMRDIIRRTDEAGVDFTLFDVNGRRRAPDGYIDGIMILTNIPFGGIGFPFAYYNRGDNLAGGTGGPLIVDGVKISHLAIAGEADLFVMVHEFGHILGLTDLYDEGRTYPGLHLSFMGSWPYDPKVPLPDAETRYRLRWANLFQVSGRQRVTIRPSEAHGDVYRLGTGEEYFLVENRGPGGAFDREFSARGLVVFHVDRRVKLLGDEGRFQERVVDCVNCDKWHPYIRLVQADGRFDLQQPGSKVNYPDDLFTDGTSIGPDPSGIPLSATHQVQSTNWYSGAASGISISEVVVHADGTITATLEGPKADVCGEPLCAEGPGCQPASCALPDPCGCGQGGASAVALLGLIAFGTATRRRRGAPFAAAPR